MRSEMLAAEIDTIPLLVIPPGANVHLTAPPDSEPNLGVVVQVCLRESGVQYQVAWWNGRQRYAEWLEACEVRPASKNVKLPIGFLQG